MKRRWLFASAVLMFVNCGFVSAGDNAFQKFMRWTGYGFGPGYHTCPCPKREASQHPLSRPCPDRVVSPSESVVPYTTTPDCGCARREPAGRSVMAQSHRNDLLTASRSEQWRARDFRQVPRTATLGQRNAADHSINHRSKNAPSPSAWRATYNIRLND